jgi:hypothetical protein
MDFIVPHFKYYQLEQFPKCLLNQLRPFYIALKDYINYHKDKTFPRFTTIQCELVTMLENIMKYGLTGSWFYIYKTIYNKVGVKKHLASKNFPWFYHNSLHFEPDISDYHPSNGLKSAMIPIVEGLEDFQIVIPGKKFHYQWETNRSRISKLKAKSLAYNLEKYASERLLDDRREDFKERLERLSAQYFALFLYDFRTYMITLCAKIPKYFLCV